MIICYCTSTAVAMGICIFSVPGLTTVAAARAVVSAAVAVAVGIGSIEEMAVLQMGQFGLLLAQVLHIAMCPHGRRHVSTDFLKHTTHSLLLLESNVPMGMAMAGTGWLNTEPISVALAIGIAVATGGGGDSGQIWKFPVPEYVRVSTYQLPLTPAAREPCTVPW